MYYFIVNVKSRTGKAQQIWEELEQELIHKQVEYEAYITEYEGHGRKLAQEICSQPGQIQLIVVGGDGTANEVIDGMHDFDRISFGYIPTGSGNDLARGLKITGTPSEVLHHILSSDKIMEVDLGRVSHDGGERLFAISAGLGVDADVCKQALTSKLKKFLNKLHLGQLTYVLLTIKTLFTMPLTDAHLEFDDGTTKDLKGTIFVAAMIHACEGGGVPMAPQASAQDGLLSVCCVHGIRRGVCLFYLPVLCMGKHEKLHGFDVINCRSFHITLEDPMIVHADGEFCGELQNMKFECLPHKYRVIV